ncbi:MAG: hypothetical protein LBD36_02400 [Holosporales bacterium]|jgi:hypothetical protein|nr:hypothetical protein [Holosporales bacterium]
MKDKIILLLATVSHIAVYSATDAQIECVHVNTTSRPVSEEIDSFIGISKKVYSSTVYTQNPIHSEDGLYILKTLSVQKGDTIINYPCRFSTNEQTGIIYEEIEGVKVPLQLEFCEGRIIAVTNLLTHTQIHDSKLLSDSEDGYPTSATLYDLSIVAAIGTPNAHFTLDEYGNITIHVDTLFKNVKTLKTELSELSANVSSHFSTVEQTLQSLPTDVTAEVNQQISKTLSQFKEESLATTESTTSNAVNQLSTTTVCQTQKIIETVDETRKVIKSTNNSLLTQIDLLNNTLLEQIGSTNSTIIKQINLVIKEQNEAIITTSSGIRSAIDSQTKRLVSTTQHIVQQSTDSVSVAVERTEQAIVAGIEKLLGISFQQGNVVESNLLEKLTTLVYSVFEHLAQSDDVRMAINTMTQVFNTHGQLPLLYLGSIESMLYGHTNISQPLVITPIERYMSEFESLTKHEFVRDLRVPLRDIITKIQIINDFFQSTDATTLSRTLLMFIKVFGTKFPVYDEAAINITQYCSDAHFSIEDFGLYGWIKDIHSILTDFTNAVAQKDTELVSKGRITRGKIKALLKGELDNEQRAIPPTHFNGLQDFPSILQHCVNTISVIQTNSPTARIEKKIDELIAAITAERRSYVDNNRELVHAVTSATSLLYGIKPESHKHRKSILSAAVTAPLSTGLS